MKWTKLALIAFLAVSVLTACSKDKAQQTQPVQQEENKQEEIVDVAATEAAQEEKSDNSFPVPITFENKKEKLEELPEATQAAIQWTYDYFSYFNSNDIETEEEFYQMMKEKHMKDRQINADADFIEGQIAGYGSGMLPKFTHGQEMKIESFEVWPEVPVGLNIKVPMYIEFKDKDNMHAIAISYDTVENDVAGASPDFPMILD